MKPVHRDFAIREIGCIACRIAGCTYPVGCEKHHLNAQDRHGGKRLGEAYTVGLCPWHHRGVPFEFHTEAECRDAYGPSWAREPSAFRSRFGNGESLLAYQNDLLKQWELGFIA